MLLLFGRDEQNRPSHLMICLAGVVAVALVGGLWPAPATSVVSFTVLNWFFMESTGLLLIDQPEDVVVLVVFVLVAGAEASTPAALSRSVLSGEDTAQAIVQRLARTFAMAGGFGGERTVTGPGARGGRRRPDRQPAGPWLGRHHRADMVDALDAGADGYVTRLYAMNELLARLRIDLARRQVFRAGAEVRFSPTEWSLLEVLVRNRGRLVDRKLLLHEVWGPAYSTETNYLRVYTAQLRRKLERDPSHPRHILTHPGTGYRFEVGPGTRP